MRNRIADNGPAYLIGIAHRSETGVTVFIESPTGFQRVRVDSSGEVRRGDHWPRETYGPREKFASALRKTDPKQGILSVDIRVYTLDGEFLLQLIQERNLQPTLVP
jgi:hypothetical protein